MKDTVPRSWMLSSLTAFVLVSCASDNEAELSFYDFKVGEELSTCYELAKHDPDIHDLKAERKSDYTIASFNVTIPNYNYPNDNQLSIKVKGWAYAFNGFVFNIHLFAESSLSRDAIPAMYKSKYGDKKTKKSKTTWRFSNGSIVVGEQTHREKRKQLIDGWEKLKLRYIDSYYEEVEVNVFDGMYIDYENKESTSLKRKLFAIYEKESLQKLDEMKAKWAREDAEREEQKKAEAKKQEEAKKQGISSVRF